MDSQDQQQNSKDTTTMSIAFAKAVFGWYWRGRSAWYDFKFRNVNSQTSIDRAIEKKLAKYELSHIPPEDLL